MRQLFTVKGAAPAPAPAGGRPAPTAFAWNAAGTLLCVAGSNGELEAAFRRPGRAHGASSASPHAGLLPALLLLVLVLLRARAGVVFVHNRSGALVEEVQLESRAPVATVDWDKDGEVRWSRAPGAALPMVLPVSLLP